MDTANTKEDQKQNSECVGTVAMKLGVNQDLKQSLKAQQ